MKENKRKYEGKYFSICHDSDGVEYVEAGEEVIVVPLTADRRVILISEPAPAFGTALVLPGGSTSQFESLEETANREMQEEIGFRAKRLDLLGKIKPFSKYLAVKSTVFLGRSLVLSPLKGDETYTIKQHEVPFEQIEQQIMRGQIGDARVIASLFMARAYLKGELGL